MDGFLSSDIHNSTIICHLYLRVYLLPELKVRVVIFTLQAYHYGKIMKCVMVRVNQSKPLSAFRILTDYLIGNEPGGVY